VKPAIIAGNGECLWERDVAAAVVGLVAKGGLAVVGCEIYRRHHVGWGTYVGYWDVGPPRGDDEAWSGFVPRCAQSVLCRLAGEPSADPRTGGNDLLYFLAVVDESQYGRLAVVDRRATLPQAARVGTHPIQEIAGQKGGFGPSLPNRTS
jgi:hypothetical protein